MENSIVERAPPEDRLQNLHEDLSETILLGADVPDLLRVARTSLGLRTLVRNGYFISRYNNRQNTQAWIFGHCFRTTEPTDMGIIHGTRVSDGWRVVRPIDRLPEWPKYSSLEYLDSSGPLSLLRSENPPTFMVVNAFQPQNKLVDIPVLEKPKQIPNHFDHVAIHNLTGGEFAIVYATVVENKPVVYVYWSDIDLWVAYECVDGLPPGNPTSDFAFVDDGPWDNRILYNIYLLGGLFGRYFQYRSCKTLGNPEGTYTSTEVIEPPPEYIWTAYAGDWVVLLKLRTVSATRERLYGAYIFVKTACDREFRFISRIPLHPSLTIHPHYYSSMSARVLDHVLYIYVATQGNPSFKHRPAVHIFRYHTIQKHWLPPIRWHFPPINGYDHSAQAFTNRLTLLSHPQPY